MTSRMFLGFLLATAMSISAPVTTAQEAEEGGIFGTGVTNMGVFGTITKLGSIYVNGTHIEWTDDVIVTSPRGTITTKDLKPGHTVAVSLVQDQGRYLAQKIDEVPALIGKFDAGKVLGVTVAAPHEFDQGTWLAVSGLWSGVGLEISNIDEIAPIPAQFVQGDYRPGTQQIGEVTLPDLTLENARPTETVRAFLPEDGTATLIQTGMFDPEIRVILAEGYLSASTVTGEYAIRGSGTISYAPNKMQMTREKQLFCAEVVGDFAQLKRLAAPTSEIASSCLVKR